MVGSRAAGPPLPQRKSKLADPLTVSCPPPSNSGCARLGLFIILANTTCVAQAQAATAWHSTARRQPWRRPNPRQAQRGRGSCRGASVRLGQPASGGAAHGSEEVAPGQLLVSIKGPPEAGGSAKEAHAQDEHSGLGEEPRQGSRPPSAQHAVAAAPSVAAAQPQPGR